MSSSLYFLVRMKQANLAAQREAKSGYQFSRTFAFFTPFRIPKKTK